MQTTHDARVILSIQHLRGIAAMMVVWHHAARQIPAIGAYFPSPFGANGVDLFFVISGFIMVVTTAGRQARPETFMARRLVRVVPLYWLLTTLMAGVALMSPGAFRSLVVMPDTFVKSLLFIPHFSTSFPDQVLPLLVPGWTLNFEMYFYLVFALALALPQSCRIPALVLYFGVSVAIGWLFGPFSSALAQTYTNPMLLEFVAGALIARAWLAGRLNLSVPPSVSLIALGFVLLVSADMVEGLNKLVGASLIVVGALNTNLVGWRQNLLQKLGDASYSIYLTHLFTLGLLRVLWSRLFADAATPATAWLFMALALALCAAGGYASYLCLETPLLARLAARRRTGRAARPA